MVSLLLALIYLAFIGLGLPDSLLGSAWPAMQVEFGSPLGYASILTVIVSGTTVVSTLLSGFLVRKLGTGLVVALSTGLVALALLAFSFAYNFGMLIAFSLPYGLGAGAIDSALNDYVATHYNSRHMNWLHCFWGVGAAVSPFIMSFALSTQLGWNAGYSIVSIIQLVITALLLVSLPLWKMVHNKRYLLSANKNEQGAVINTQNGVAVDNAMEVGEDINLATGDGVLKDNLQQLNFACNDLTLREINVATISATEIDKGLNFGINPTTDKTVIKKNKSPLLVALQRKGVLVLLIAMFAYIAIESITGLWVSSYFVLQKGIDVDTAAFFGSLFYIGVTVGRFLSGFLANRLGDKNMIRYGSLVICLGIVVMILPSSHTLALVGLIVMGLGCAPVLPAMLHATPINFGKQYSQSIISLCIACIYLSSSLTQGLFGTMVTLASIVIFPFVILAFVVVLILFSERMNGIVKKQKVVANIG